MKKRQLEMLLETVYVFERPSLKREQYATPASVAADVLFLAKLKGDLNKVCDLGCGTGILAIGAALLGARVIGIEIDPLALNAAKINALRLGVEVDLVRGDVGAIALRGIDTVLMNPPFGAQKTSAGDRPFLKAATNIAGVIYSIHNLGSEGFIRRFVEPCRIEEIYRIKYPLKRSFQFHAKEVKTIEVELYRIVCPHKITKK